MMRWIGYFLLLMLFLVIFLIFVKIRIQLVVREKQQFVEIRYLWFKYQYNLNQLFTKEVKEEAFQKAEDAAEQVKEKYVVKKMEQEVKIESVKEVDIEQTDRLNAKKEEKIKKVKRKKQKTKKVKVKKKLDMSYIRFMYRKFKLIYKVSKKVLIRFTHRIRVHELDSVIHIDVNDPMLNGCLIGGIWGLQANIYAFISRYVKVMEHYHFDVKSQFSGNQIFMDLTCIVSIRIVDIIVVLLSSFKELMTIKKTIRLEEDL